MQKKYVLLTLALALILGPIFASIPPARAQQPVRFYVSPTIVPSTPVGDLIIVEVWIESDPGWDNTPEGIVGYALSVSVDPNALEVMTAAKIVSMGGFLEDFLVRYMYDLFGYTTAFLVGPIDKSTGTITDVSEYILGYSTLGVGAGGGPIKLMRWVFRSLSDVIPSPIDIFGRYVTEISATYTTADGVDHYVDIMDDGYYIADTSSTKMFFDSGGTYDPANPLGSDWHELWPQYCDWWTLESWVDNGDGILSASDQIDMTNIGTGEHVDFHIDWLNPTPIPGDGKKDMVVIIKEPPVPEFPLGLGLLMLMAPAIPIVYLWRIRKKEM